jgi:hypothetical protein
MVITMLVKDGDKRFAKWKRNYDIIKNGQPVRQLTPQAEQKLKNQYIVMANLENEIKKIIGQTNTPTMLNFSYLAFTREIYGLIRRYKSNQLAQKVEFAMYKWQAQSLDKELLEKIRDHVYKMMNLKLTQ